MAGSRDERIGGELLAGHGMDRNGKVRRGTSGEDGRSGPEWLGIEI